MVGHSEHPSSKELNCELRRHLLVFTIHDLSSIYSPNGTRYLPAQDSLVLQPFKFSQYAFYFYVIFLLMTEMLYTEGEQS